MAFAHVLNRFVTDFVQISFVDLDVVYVDVCPVVHLLLNMFSDCLQHFLLLSFDSGVSESLVEVVTIVAQGDLAL